MHDFQKYFESFLYNNMAEGIWQIYAEPAVLMAISKAGVAFASGSLDNNYFQLHDIKRGLLFLLGI